MGLTSPIKDKDWVSVRQAIARLGSLKLGPTSTPTFAGITLSGLTASRLAATNASKTLVSSDLYGWVAGTANRVTVADDADGTVTLSSPQDTDTSATMILSGLLPATADSYDLGAYTAGSTVGSPMGLLLSLTYASGAGTDDRWRHLYLSGDLSDGSNTLSVAECKTAFDHVTESGASHSYIDQDVTASASPTFAGADLTGITDGNVPYMSASGFADSPISVDTGEKVGIGTASPTSRLTVTKTTLPQLKIHYTETDGGIKYGQIGGEQYNKTAEAEGFSLIGYRAANNDNSVCVGGGAGEINAATVIKFYTAATDSTRTGTERVRIDGSGNVGINTTTPNTKLQVVGAISSATLALSAAGPTDNLDVSGVNTIFVDTSSNNVTLGGTVGGVDGQVLNIVIHDATNNTTLEHNEGTGNQDFVLHAGADEVMTSEYGGWTFVNHGGDHWHDCSHAKHV